MTSKDSEDKRIASLVAMAQAKIYYVSSTRKRGSTYKHGYPNKALKRQLLEAKRQLDGGATGESSGSGPSGSGGGSSSTAAPRTKAAMDIKGSVDGVGGRVSGKGFALEEGEVLEFLFSQEAKQWVLGSVVRVDTANQSFDAVACMLHAHTMPASALCCRVGTNLPRAAREHRGRSVQHAYT